MANTINPNDTLSGILGSLVAPVAPNLTGVPITSTTPPAPGMSQTPAPTGVAELDSFLADWQNQQIMASSNWDTYFETPEGQDRLSNLKDRVLPGEELPKPPKLVEEFEKKRAEYGLDELEQSLNDLRREERDQQAIRRARVSGTYEEATRMSAIQGQVSEIERQEMERLDFIGREIQYHTDLINSAYNVINLYTNLMQTDWQNAKEWWTTQFNANMSIYQQLRGEFESDRSFAQQQLEYKQTVARANLQIYMDMISNGQLFYDNMDMATKLEVNKLEIQSGLGLGFLSKIQMDPDKQIKSITTRTAGTNKYADILRIDPKTGKVSVETISLGKEYSYSGGGGGGGSSASTKAAEQLAADREGANSKLAAKIGSDGKISPTTWRIVRNEWIGLGNDPALFNQYFGHYVNTSHAKDYEGFSAPATQGTSMGTQTGGFPQVNGSVHRTA